MVVLLALSMSVSSVIGVVIGIPFMLIRYYIRVQHVLYKVKVM